MKTESDTVLIAHQRNRSFKAF